MAVHVRFFLYCGPALGHDLPAYIERWYRVMQTYGSWWLYTIAARKTPLHVCVLLLLYRTVTPKHYWSFVLLSVQAVVL